MNIPIKLEIAENPNTSPETLALLAKDEEYDIRREVAVNPNTPLKTLALLANDKDKDVSEITFKSPILPNEYKMLHLMEY